jgi:transcriptional regulator GlxA family with amidase domain
MSERSFARAFREDTGRTPAEFVMSARLQAARRLLEETELAPKTVAQRCGLGSAAAMRRAFVRELGISPTEYRDKFSSHVTLTATIGADRSLSPAK